MIWNSLDTFSHGQTALVQEEFDFLIFFLLISSF